MMNYATMNFRKAVRRILLTTAGMLAATLLMAADFLSNNAGTGTFNRNTSYASVYLAEQYSWFRITTITSTQVNYEYDAYDPCDGVVSRTATIVEENTSPFARTGSVFIQQRASLTITVQGTNASKNGCADGTAYISTNTLCDLSYNWSTGATNSSISGLVAGTYYVTVTSESGDVATGSVTITQPAASAPVVETNQTVANVTSSTADVAGSISSVDCNAYTYGFCWNTTGNPTVDDSKKTITGNFQTQITGLSANTKYYVRAFVTQSATSYYGSQVSFTTNQVPAGTGTQADPYQIATLSDLHWLSVTPAAWGAGVYIVQAADIDATDTKNWDNGAGFLPIANVSNFYGNYNGQKHKIKNLTINRNSLNNVGLFGQVSTAATVSNLIIEDCLIDGYNNVGGIAGRLATGNITNCGVSGTVKSTNAAGATVGGVVGTNSAGNVQYCYSTASVSARFYAGGLVGYSTTGSIMNCYASGTVAVTGSSVAGLVGYNSSSSDSTIITNCYASGAVSGSVSAGLVYASASTNVTNCYWDTQTTGQSASIGGGTGYTTAQMKVQSNFAGWDFVGETTNGTDDVWLMNPATGYPSLAWQIKPKGSGTQADPYQIATLDNLLWLSITPSAWVSETYFIQTADIDAAATALWNGGAGFLPIARTSMFNAKYDGQKHIIKNLTVNRPTENRAGLFGNTSGAISNVYIVDCYIDGYSVVGGIVGYNYAGTVKNCYVSGTVKSTATDNGLSVGGLVGMNYGTISSCFSTATVSAISQAGGLVGNNYSGIIKNCYANGAVSVTSSQVGGFAGYNSSGTITNCYASGSVTGAAAGGFLYTNAGGTITNCFYDATNISTGLGTGLTAAEMKTPAFFTAAGWDFANTWGFSVMLNSGYPCLFWQGTLVAPSVTTLAASAVATDTAALGVSITDLGFPNPVQFGVVYGTSPSPTIAGSKTEMGFASQMLTASKVVKNLLPNTKYYARAYAINVADTVYGNELTFTTLPLSTAPAGSGTQNDPYQIATLENLYWLSVTESVWSQNYFIQTADIDASVTSSWNGGAGFSPIGTSTSNFKGNYDGKRYVIKNITIDRATDYVGLFGYANGSSISNLGLTNCTVTGNSYVGILAGYNSTGTIMNCYATGAVNSTYIDSYCGGLAGFNGSGTISRCYTNVAVTAVNRSGGLVARNVGTIENCYTLGAVTSTGDYAGGLVGSNASNQHVVSNCYALGKVTGGNTTTCGALIGYVFTGTFQNNYWDNTVNTISAEGTGKTTDDMKKQTTFTGWPFVGTGTNIWGIAASVNNGYPYLNWQMPWVVMTGVATGAPDTTITMKASVDSLGQSLRCERGFCWSATSTDPTIADSYVIVDTAQTIGQYTTTITSLKANTTYTLRAFARNELGISYGNGWTITTAPFPLKTPAGSGTPGDPYKIETLSDLFWLSLTPTAWAQNTYFIQTANINASATATWYDGAGFSPIGKSVLKFSGNYDGQGYRIYGLTIARKSSDCVGLFGYTSGSQIKNLGLVNCKVTGLDTVGGLVGYMDTTTLQRCYYSGTVTGSGDYVGGLAGFSSVSRMRSCYANATTTSSFDYMGGLAGYCGNSYIDSCFSTGSVEGNQATSDNVGGLIGYHEVSSTGNSYSTCSVVGNSYVGGLIGQHVTSGSISNCFAAGKITGNTISGGLIGSDNTSAAVNCYWDTETTMQANSLGGGTGLPTADMKTQATYSGWDFTSTWAMTSISGYPILKWQLPKLTFNEFRYYKPLYAEYNCFLDSLGQDTVKETGIIFDTIPNGMFNGNCVRQYHGGWSSKIRFFFYSGRSDMRHNTTYYVRSFAYNNMGFVYGKEVVTTTKPDTLVVGTITQPTCDVLTGSVELTNLPGGTWTIKNADTSVAAGLGTSITVTVPAGSYYFTVTSDKGVTSAPTAGIVIAAKGAPGRPAAPDISNVVYCQGATATDLTPDDGDYLWYSATTGGSGSLDPLVPSTTTPSTTSYWISLDVDGCEGPRAQVTVTVRELPSLSMKDSATCQGNTLDLDYATPAGGTYTHNNDVITSFNATQSGTFDLKYSFTDGNSCSNSVTSILTINPKPELNAGSDTSVCAGTPLSLNASVTDGTYTGTLSYSWQASSSLSSTIVSNPGYASSTVGNERLYATVTDEINCSGIDSVDITVFSLPTVSLAAKDTLCAGGAAYTITATVSGTPGTGTWSGSTLLSNATNTSVDITPLGTNTTEQISYKYTDENNCHATATKAMVIYAPATPSALNNSVLSTEKPLAFDATGQNVKWYDRQNCITQIAAGNTYTPNDIPRTISVPDSLVPGTFCYCYTQTVSGCESQKAQACIDVIVCPARAPISGGDVAVCKDITAGKKLQATAKGNGVLSWFENSDKTTQIANGTTYTPTVTAPGRYTYYVAEYDNAQACSGPVTPVTLTINALPTASVTVKDSVCSSDAPLAVTLNPTKNASSSLGASVATMLDASGNFVPSGNGDASGDYTLTYNYTDINGCTNTAKDSVHVTYAQPPVAEADKTILKSDLGKQYAQVSVANGTGNYRWWTDANASIPALGVSIGSPYTTPLDTVNVHPGNYKTGTFYVTQEINGCRSKTDAVTVTIVDCPWDAPTANNVSVCADATLPDLIATLPNSTPQSGVSWQWYDAGLQPISNAVSSTYNPGISVAGTSTYFVDYVQVDPVSGKACASPKTTVTWNINPVPVPVIDNTVKSDYCYSEEITLSGHEETGIKGSGQFTPSAIDLSGITAGKSYTINYIFTTDSGCSASVSKVITAHYVAPPAVTNGYKNISNLTNQVDMTATPDGTNTVNWYQSGVNVGTGTSYSYTGTIPDKDTCMTYEVTQVFTSGSFICESKPDTASTCFFDCQALAPKVADTTICNYASAPEVPFTRTTLNNHTYNMRIYTSDPMGDEDVTSASQTTGSSYTVPSVTDASYYVAEYDVTDACLGPAQKFSVMVHTVTPPTASSLADICENSASSVELSVDPNTIMPTSLVYWYPDDISTAASVGNGNTLKLVNTTDLTPGLHKFYASQVTEDGCQSSKVEVSYIIIPQPDAPAASGNWTCFGQANTSLEAIPNAGCTVSWYETIGSTIPVQMGGNSFKSLETAVGIYTYYVRYENGFGCVSEESAVQYEIRQLPVVSVSLPLSAYCATESEVSISTNPSYGSIGVLIKGDGVTGSRFSPSSAGVGVHKITVVDNASYGCTDSATFSVTVNPLPVADAGKDTTVVYGSDVTLRATGGSSYSWSNDVSGAENKVFPTKNTKYTVTVGSAEGCTATDSVSVFVSLSASITADDGFTNIPPVHSQNLTASGADSFTWSTGESGSTITVSPAATTTYTVTATNGDSISVKSITITIDQSYFHEMHDTICYGDSVGFIDGNTYKTSGKYDFEEHSVSGNFSNFYTLNLTVLGKITSSYNKEITEGSSCTFGGKKLSQPGDYVDTLVSRSGCDSIVYLHLTVIPKPVDTVLTLSTTRIILPSIAGSSSSFSITSNTTWTVATGATWLHILTTSGSGNATISVSADKNSGTVREAALVVSGKGVENDTIIVAQGVPAVVVNTPSAVNQVVGTAIPYINLTNIFSYAGELTYTVSSSNNIVVNPSMIVTGSILGLVAYQAGEATITISARTPYGDVTSVTVSVTITTSSQTQICNGLSIGTPEITGSKCAGDSTGSVSITVTGGTQPYHYWWSNQTSGSKLTGVTAGTYTVFVIDSNSCTQSKVVEIVGPEKIQVTHQETAPGCGESDGAISVAVGGGTAPYSYLWSNKNTGEALANVAAGVYKITITDKNGCSTSETINLSNDNAPAISLAKLDSTYCNKLDGAITIEVKGQHTPFSFRWNDGTATQNRAQLGVGSYQVTVTDTMHCASTFSAIVPAISFKAPEILLVSVSQESGKNLIVWNREKTSAIKHYTIYRQSGIEYIPVDTMEYSDQSYYFVDNTPGVDPGKCSYRYKLSATDMCGNESQLTREFKTMYLQENMGLGNKVNLSWEAYEGADFAWFLVYRTTKSGGTVLIDSVGAQTFSYTDAKPPVDVKSYHIGIRFPKVIDPSTFKSDSGPYSYSLSNMAESELLASPVTENAVDVFPNPASDKMHVNTGVTIEWYEITDGQGRVVASGQFAGGTVDVSKLVPGIYFLKLAGNDTEFMTKFIKE